MDNDLKEATLCTQIPLPAPLDDFYFSSSAIDLGGECSSEIREAIFKPVNPIEIVNGENKQMGDNFFAYRENQENYKE